MAAKQPRTLREAILFFADYENCKKVICESRAESGRKRGEARADKIEPHMIVKYRDARRKESCSTDTPVQQSICRGTGPD